MNAWICFAPRTSVILRVVCSVRNSTLGCRHIKWLGNRLCEHSGRLSSSFLLAAWCALCITVCEELCSCTDHHRDLVMSSHGSRRTKRVAPHRRRHGISSMEAEPLVDQITAKTRQDEAWTNEVMGHATGIVGSRPTRTLASPFTLHVVSVDRSRVMWCHDERFHAPSCVL